jgi:hypothetical protein
MAIGSQGKNSRQFDDSKMIESHRQHCQISRKYCIDGLHSFLSPWIFKENSSYVLFGRFIREKQGHFCLVD